MYICMSHTLTGSSCAKSCSLSSLEALLPWRVHTALLSSGRAGVPSTWAFRASTSVVKYGLWRYINGSFSHPHSGLCLKMAKKCLHGMCHFVQSWHVHEGIVSGLSLPKLTLWLVPDDLTISKNPFSWSLSTMSLAVTLLALAILSRLCKMVFLGLSCRKSGTKSLCVWYVDICL